MTSRSYLFVILFTVISFSLPFVAQAAIPFFGPIIPAENAGCAASWGMVLTVVNNIISFLITIAIVFVAPITIAYAGFLFVVNPVNAGGKEQAKSILLNTVVGIVIALAGWLIVDVFMSVLYNGTFGSWSSIISSGGVPCLDQKGLQSSSESSVPGSSTQSYNRASNVGITTYSGSGTQTQLGIEQAVRQQLLQSGVVTFNNNPCLPGSSGQGCTNLAGMRQETINQIINIANRASSICSGCSVTVTGGTEPGHEVKGTYTHKNGYKVDLRTGTGIDNLLGSLRNDGTRTGSEPGSRYRDSCNNEYVRASDHWDITIFQTCPI